VSRIRTTTGCPESAREQVSRISKRTGCPESRREQVSRIRTTTGCPESGRQQGVPTGASLLSLKSDFDFQMRFSLSKLNFVCLLLQTICLWLFLLPDSKVNIFRTINKKRNYRFPKNGIFLLIMPLLPGVSLQSSGETKNHLYFQVILKREERVAIRGALLA
jgi:hypothetical protein